MEPRDAVMEAAESRKLQEGLMVGYPLSDWWFTTRSILGLGVEELMQLQVFIDQLHTNAL